MSNSFGRALVFAAHPDDETLACGGLLQRAPAALVVFAVDAAPRRYGFERRFGSLQNYSETRFREAVRALSRIPNCEIQRLKGPTGEPFGDRHLFQNLSEAFSSLLAISRSFSPNVIVSHTYEGCYIDHDACHILATRVATALEIPQFEFPLYWKAADGRDVFQNFRRRQPGELTIELTIEEVAVKEQCAQNIGRNRKL